MKRLFLFLALISSVLGQSGAPNFESVRATTGTHGQIRVGTAGGGTLVTGSSGTLYANGLALGTGGGTPGGSSGQVQYNNAGVFGSITGATTNGTTLTLVAPVLGTPASVNLANATFPTLNQSTTGTAGFANVLSFPRTINGVSFDGSANVTVTAAAGTVTGATLASNVTASSLTSFGASVALGTPASINLANGVFPTLNQSTTGTASVASLLSPVPTWNQSTTGTAAAANVLSTARTINGVSFDGSGNITVTVPVATGISGLGGGVADFLAVPSKNNINAMILGDALAYLQTAQNFSQPQGFLAGGTLGGNFVATGTLTNLGTLVGFTSGGTPGGTNGQIQYNDAGAFGGVTIITGTNGGTGVSNAGTLTNASNTTVTGGGTVSLGGFTLTVPATGTAALIGTANTFTAAQTNSTAGAASLPALRLSGVPFAGTGTTSFPLLYISDSNATASTTLNTAGTYFGVNGDGSQDLMNLLKDGSSVFKVASNGATTGGSFTAGGSILQDAVLTIGGNGTSTFRGYGVSNAVQIGANHATVATNVVLKSHNVTTGTGANMTIASGTGSVAGGAVILATSSGASATIPRLTIAADGSTTIGTGTGTSMKNIRHGISGAMVLGSVTVTDAGCTADTRYFFSAHTLGTISIPGGYFASTRTAGVSFVITSSQATETSTIDWMGVEP